MLDRVIRAFNVTGLVFAQSMLASAAVARAKDLSPHQAREVLLGVLIMFGSGAIYFLANYEIVRREE